MSFANKAGLFAHQLDLATDQVLLVGLTEQDYRDASFLDARILTPNRQSQWHSWGQLADLSHDIADDARWIFHIGHVGSTLISRLLGEARNALAIREPQLLRQFAELKQLQGLAHSPWPPEQYQVRLEVAVRWLSRSFGETQKAVVKASSFTSDLASDILAAQARKSVFLFVSPERYIQTILAGENSRKELAALAGIRLQRLNQRLESDQIRLWELSEAQRAAMCWACEMSALEAASNDQVLWLDFDGFLDQPGDGLKQIATHLNIELDQQKIESLVNGPIMTQYSKAPEHGYSRQLRDDVLSQAANDHGGAISAALNWLESVGKQFPAIGAALDRSGR